MKVNRKFLGGDVTDDAELEAAINAVEELISQESTARQTNDNTLQTNINSEATARQNADSTLQSNIDSEASTRQTNDETLQTNINSEATTRSNADTALDGKIEAEEGARQAADQGLQTQIDTKYPSANPNGYETPTQLNNRDTENRSRANHTGTQLANTVSDLSTAVLAVVLTGINVALTSAIVATDDIKTAFGKAQGQINLRALSARTISAGTGLSGGGDLTADRTISMPNTGTAGTYGAADKYNATTVDAQGRVTSIVPTLISILASQVSDFANAARSTVLTGLSTSTSSAIVATDTVLAAFGKAQAQINTMLVSVTPQTIGTANATGTSSATAKADHVHAHGDQTTPTLHAAVTQSVNGFMIAADKVKLDNALGRFLFSSIPDAVAASNTTFTAVGKNYIWVQTRNTLVKSLALSFNVTYTNRSFELRLVNVSTGAVLAASTTITASGNYLLTVSPLPSADCLIGVQIRKTTSGGTSPSLDGAQLEFETI